MELASAPVTSMKVIGKVQGVWEELFGDDSTGQYLDFENINFAKFCFGCDNSPKTIGEKISIKKWTRPGSGWRTASWMKALG